MQNLENNRPGPQPRGIEHLLNPAQQYALEELIASGEAVFNLIRFSELDMGIKDAFYMLEKQFDFYKEQLTKEL